MNCEEYGELVKAIIHDRVLDQEEFELMLVTSVALETN